MFRSCFEKGTFDVLADERWDNSFEKYKFLIVTCFWLDKVI